jgi:ferredoxin
MIEADVYERLREKISSWPIRVQKTKEVTEILRILFTEEEAEFLNHFTGPYQNPETMDQIVERTGKPRQKAQTIVDSLLSRSLLFRFVRQNDGNAYYSLMRRARLYHGSHDKESERILFLEERCIGCGLCAHHCPNDALKLVKVKDEIPEMTPRDAFIRVEAERIH